MPFLPKYVRKVIKTTVFFTFLLFGVQWLIPATYAYSPKVSMEVDGSYKELEDGMIFSGMANGKIELIDPGETLIVSYTVTIDGQQVAHGEELNTKEPVFFNFDTSKFSDGQYTLNVHALLTDPTPIDVSVQVQINNTPPAYTINVRMTDENFKSQQVKNGTVLVGKQTVDIATFRDGVPAKLKNFVVIFRGQQLYVSSGFEQSSLHFSFDSNDFQDGTYEFKVTASNETLTITFIASVTVQNRNPILLGIALGFFGIAALVFILQVRKSKIRTIVACTAAARARAARAMGTPGTSALAAPPLPSAPPAAPASPASVANAPVTSTNASGDPKAKTLARLSWRMGWKSWVPLAGLVVISVLLLVWVVQGGDAVIVGLFGDLFTFLRPQVVFTIALALSVVSFLAWRKSAGRAIGAILYILLVLGAIYVLGQVIMSEGLFSGFFSDVVTEASVVIVLGTTMLSWLAAPLPASVLALRFTRWARTPPVTYDVK